MARDSEVWERAYAATKKAYRVPGFTKKPKPIVKEPMVLQSELVSINRQLKVLESRKKSILKQMRERGEKPIRSEYFDKQISIYVLRLEDNCWYVGMTRNIDKRFKKHCSAKGAANWTRLHKPIEIAEIRPANTSDDSEASKLEDDATLEYALRYGSQSVRGGGYCQTKPIWPELILQNERAN